MEKLKVLDLFSGIGGFSLGLERAGGFETVAFCEIEEFPRKVLAKHWPEVPIYEDVTTLTGDILRRDGISVDVITGGFPCQDISTAGKQAGMGEGTRSGLWSEIVRLIGELSPRYVIVENVANLLSGPSEKRGGWFGRILGDLAECGYDAEWENIPASALGASHRRERVWVIGYPCEARPKQYEAVGEHNEVELRYGVTREARPLAHAGCIGQQGQGGAERQIHPKAGKNREAIDSINAIRWPFEPPVCGGNDGVPNGMDRVAACGNAIIPQIPEIIGRAIMEAEGMT